jgi:predicted AAA+ superfamily ATPase
MQTISAKDIVRRIRAENPWWDDKHEVSADHQKWAPRAYFDLFFPLVQMKSVHRAVVLMGPRRVGKTVMIHHAIKALLESGVTPNAICYFSVDHPIYNELTLEKLLKYYVQASGVNPKSEQLYVFFDEIQYLRKWEIHLKSFVDSHRNIKSIASGSAAAALKLRSAESGAGRFTDFLLPPLTFYEYLRLLDKSDLLRQGGEQVPEFFFAGENIDELNKEFLNYLNFGGYPEVIFNRQIQADPGRFIKSDIIDKVLLRDLPGLYGIRDIQELNYLFTTLAFNTANEISLEELSQNSGVAKNTIKRYIEYLEAAFLIKVVHRIDHSAKRFRRANFFKVYLTNPSMRAALFSPVDADDPAVAGLAETAIYSQWFHSGLPLYYARWNKGEVDIVHLSPNQKAGWVVEVKWSDRYVDHPEELKSLTSFCRANQLTLAFVTSRTKFAYQENDPVRLFFIQASVYCYTVGANILRGMKQPMETALQQLGFHKGFNPFTENGQLPESNESTQA